VADYVGLPEVYVHFIPAFQYCPLIWMFGLKYNNGLINVCFFT